MEKVIGWALFVLLANYVFVVLFGYPVIYCAGAVLMSPLAGFFAMANTIALWAIVPAILMQKWPAVGGLLLVMALFEAGESLLKIMLFGQLCG